MKAVKWLKWKIGAACTVLLILVFQLVRSSPQFQIQVDQQSASKTALDPSDLRQGDDDDVMREWQAQDMPSGDSFRESDFRGTRHSGRGGGDRADVQPQDGGGYDTRTSRS